MALNMYSFFLPLNIVKYQPSFIEITLNLKPVTTSWECPAELHGTWSTRHQTDFSTWQELPDFYQRPSGATLAVFCKGRAACSSSCTSSFWIAPLMKQWLFVVRSGKRT
jgi:hypothetical protein